jgi:hypothetical protein
MKARCRSTLLRNLVSNRQAPSTLHSGIVALWARQSAEGWAGSFACQAVVPATSTRRDISASLSRAEVLPRLRGPNATPLG